MRLRFLLLYLTTIFIIFGVLLPFTVDAASPSSILVDVSPENPSPGENVIITLNSYVSNLDSVLISWSVNDKVVASLVGKKSLSVTAPAAGAETNIKVTVFLPDGEIDTKIVIRPTIMALLWQAEDSYVPPFYKGKALPTPDSSIKVVAMPEVKIGSKIINSNNLVYAWKKDYTNNQDASGYGKNYFVYSNDYLENSNTISVTASTTDQNYFSEARLNIGTYQPKILFYKNDPSLGTLWEQALSDGYQIIGAEILEAAPYFISPKDIRIPSLVFNWFINNNMITVANYKKNLMPLQAQAGTSGTSKIKLEISNTYKIFENASKEINVSF